jgi:hypothetical protein
MIRRIALSAFVLTVAGPVWGAASSDKSSNKAAPSKPDCSFGTALQWESKLDVAAKKADRENKLLMVLAVAGHFEDPFFT